jgi:hypothetical protein
VRARRHLAWPIALPLAALSALAGHAAGYTVVAPDAHERAHLLEQTGHGYFAYMPMAIGVASALAILGFAAAVVAGVRRGRPGHLAPTWLVALLPPLAFVVQEHFERYSRHGEIVWTTALEHAFVAGLVLQVPFAMLAALIAQLLSGLARRVAALIVSSAAPKPWALVAALAFPIAVDLPRAPILARGYASRPPPPPH